MWTECVVAFGYRFDAYDPGVLTISAGKCGDELLGDRRVLSEGVFDFKCVVLVLFYSE